MEVCYLSNYYIAYGINMNQEHFKSLCKNSTFISSGYLCDYRLEFKTFANIVHDKNAQVPIVVWKISDEELKKIDLYEGSLYERIMIPLNLVECKSNLTGNAYVYTMTQNEKNVILPTPQKYIDTIAEAYKVLDFELLALYAAIYSAEE